MGMFDYISHVPEVKCRKCAEPLSGWQSKDWSCLLETIPFWYVENFYTSCNKCHEWHEFDTRVMPLPPERPFSDYTLLDP
jgi:hypothetical protein